MGSLPAYMPYMHVTLEKSTHRLVCCGVVVDYYPQNLKTLCATTAIKYVPDYEIYMKAIEHVELIQQRKLSLILSTMVCSHQTISGSPKTQTSEIFTSWLYWPPAVFPGYQDNMRNILWGEENNDPSVMYCAHAAAMWTEAGDHKLLNRSAKDHRAGGLGSISKA